MDKDTSAHHNAVLSAIVDISQQLFVAGDFGEKLAKSLARLAGALDITHVYILQNVQMAHGLAFNHCFEWSQRSNKIVVNAPAFQGISYADLGLSCWADRLARGEVVYSLVADLPAEERLYLENRGILSILAAPIRQEEQWWGVIGLDDCRTPRQWLDVEITAIASLANILGAAFTTQQLYDSEKLSRERVENLIEEKEQQLHLAHVLQQVGALMTTAVEPETLYQQLFDLLAQVIDYDSVTLQLLAPDSEHMKMAAGRGFPDMDYVGEVVQQLSQASYAKLPSSPTWAVIPDTRLDQRWLAFPGIPEIRSWVGAALLVQGRFIGMLNVDSRTPNAYNAEMAATVAAFANHAAVAIERAQLYEQLQNQAANLARQVEERTAELQLERDRTLSILESVGESIIVTDQDARILYVNPAMEKQSGYTRAEILQQNPRIFRSSLTPKATYEKMWQTILNGESWSGEIVNKRKDGAYYDLAVTIAPLKTSAGEITGFVSVQSDISRLKELDRLKSKFVSNVSHELRTPLTNIKLYLTLLARGKAERRMQYLDILQREVDRLTDLIQDLLDLSQLETESLPTDRVQADLGAVLAKLMNLFGIKAAAKGIDLQTTIPATLPMVKASENHLTQLFTNLVENALTYTPEEGAVWVRVETAVVHDKPGVQIIIADTGPGISQEDLPYIFERFYRGELAKDGNLPGTGLGLAICQEIVQRYDGQISVRSTAGDDPETGAAFIVWLPVVHKAA